MARITASGIYEILGSKISTPGTTPFTPLQSLMAMRLLGLRTFHLHQRALIGRNHPGFNFPPALTEAKPYLC
jgi:hypothetical protein